MNGMFKVFTLRFEVICALALCCGFAAGAATTNTVQTTNAPASVSATKTNRVNGNDFSSFKIIADRNIFSANRSGRVASNGPVKKPTKVETFTLVGTVDYSKGRFAVFDGSSSSFRKTVTIGDSFAGFEIADVDLDHVTFTTTNGTQTVLNMGAQMRRVDDGEWTSGSGSTPSIAKSSSSSSSDDTETTTKSENNSETSSDEPAPSAADNDVLKKLMQKRKAEVKHESE
jgi:hypothetical protein